MPKRGLHVPVARVSDEVKLSLGSVSAGMTQVWSSTKFMRARRASQAALTEEGRVVADFVSKAREQIGGAIWLRAKEGYKVCVRV